MKISGQKPAPELLEKWWDQYRRTGDDESRNGLMEAYLPLVKYTAERMHAKLPDEVDVEDLISAGIFGLMEAIKGFDPERNVQFQTYCAFRIRGAILDELRSVDWVPRLVRSRATKLNEAIRSLETELGRKPDEKEIAKHLKMSMANFRKLQRDARAVGVFSLSRTRFETDGMKDVREVDVLEDKRSEDPFRCVQRKDVKELVTRGLSRAERLIVILYYFEEMTMKEIGETLDLSESRVSQMHSAILERLRTQLEKRQKELQAV